MEEPPDDLDSSDGDEEQPPDDLDSDTSDGDEAQEDLGPPDLPIRLPVITGVNLGPPRADIEVPQASPNTYDPSKARELMRGAVALASIALFAFVVIALCWDVLFSRRDWKDVEGIATSVMPVVVSVVGTTTGFYFGTKSGER
jgi:hypothetical protein